MADRVVFEPGTLRTQGTELPRPTITIIIFFIKQQQLQKGYGNKQGSTIIIYLSTMSSRVSLELRLSQIWPVLYKILSKSISITNYKMNFQKLFGLFLSITLGKWPKIQNTKYF